MKRLLAAILLVTMILPLAACGGGPGTGGGGGEGGESTYNYIDNLPESLNGKFAGEELVVAVDGNYKYELYADEKSDQTVDKLVYRRNQLIQQRFGCTVVADETKPLNAQDVNSHYDYIRDSLMEASAEFDLIALMAFQSGKLVTSGYYLDWRADTTYCKASIQSGAEWWPKAINDGSTVVGHQYLAVSDLCLTTMEMCYAVIFNKDMEHNENVALKQFNTETLYQAVDAGEWTLDAFYNIVKDFYRDNETAGTKGVRDENDRYGLAAGAGTDSDAWAFALGFQYIENDGVNYPELWSVTSKTVYAINTLRSLIASNATYCTQWGDKYDQRTQFFVDGHALFNLSTLEQLKSGVFHEMESDYGVLPYPKYDTLQKEYLTGTQDHYTVLSIPLYQYADIEMIDAVVEALSAESANTVKDAYFESILKYNSTRDENSVRMIDKIMDGRRYDLTTYHYHEIIPSTNTSTEQSLGLFFRYLIARDTSTDPATYYNSNIKPYESGFNKLITDYMGMFG